MSQVDFYVLSQSGDQARRLFACKLAEKAYRLDHRVHIIAANDADAEQIDTLLWTFRDGSFVPHEIEGRGNGEAPVTIGIGTPEAGNCDLLINLGDDIPGQVESFPRLAELVSSDDDARQRSRKHYAAYREQGHDLRTHRI